MIYFEEDFNERLNSVQINRKKTNLEEVFTQINEEFINDLISNEADMSSKKKYLLLSESNKEKEFTKPATDGIHETLYRQNETKNEMLKEA